MKLRITESRGDGLVAIWWYTDNGEFWDFSKTLDDAEQDFNCLQYSSTKNHLSLWRDVVNNHVKNEEERKQLISKGYKSIERGRVVYNLQNQRYEIICSEKLVNDPEFRKKCIDYFNLGSDKYEFFALNHYGKQELTGNPYVDSMYYEAMF